MTFTKSFLLGSSAALMGVAAAQAADLPARKAAPVEYVRVCDTYGRGFFYIPGTDTCIRIGGRLRADYAFVQASDVYSKISPQGVPTVKSDSNGQHTVGWEARARISFDTRTQTAWGVVQAAASLRMSRVNGVLDSSDAPPATGHNSSVTLEAAYVRFAGFTFGASRDNFAFMPSLTYGAGHWGSFANGAKQLAYTHNFGGGFSATIALQDYTDTTAKWANEKNTTSTNFNSAGAYYVYNSVPQINGRIDWTQSWGEISVTGAWANVPLYGVAVDAVAANPSKYILASAAQAAYDRDTNVWAVGGGVKINLPMLAAGDAIWFTAAYADGMTEYTTNWTSFKSSAYKRDVGGFVINHPSVVAYNDGSIGTVKSWNIAALLQHFWAPTWRSVLWGSYGQLNAPTKSAALAWDGKAGFGDATAWNIGTNLAWLPTRDFEIGVEVIYARVNQDVRADSTHLFRTKDDAVTGRLRVERNF